MGRGGVSACSRLMRVCLGGGGAQVEGRGGRLGRNSVFCLKEHPRPPGRRPVHCTGQRGAVAAPPRAWCLLTLSTSRLRTYLLRRRCRCAGVVSSRLDAWMRVVTQSQPSPGRAFPRCVPGGQAGATARRRAGSDHGRSGAAIRPWRVQGAEQATHRCNESWR